MNNRRQVIIGSNKKTVATCGRRIGSSNLIHENMNAKMGILLQLTPPIYSMD